MRLVEIDEVGVETAQAGFHGIHDVPAAQPPIVGQLADSTPAFCRQHNVVTLAGALQPGADHLLRASRPAAFSPSGIDIGRVDEVAGTIEKQIEHTRRLGVIRVPAEGRRAETDSGNFQAGGPELHILHDSFPSRLCGLRPSASAVLASRTPFRNLHHGTTSATPSISIKGRSKANAAHDALCACATESRCSSSARRSRNTRLSRRSRNHPDRSDSLESGRAARRR